MLDQFLTMSRDVTHGTLSVPPIQNHSTHLHSTNILRTRNNSHIRQPLFQIQFLLDFLSRTSYSDGEEGSGTSGSIGVKTESFTLLYTRKGIREREKERKIRWGTYKGECLVICFPNYLEPLSFFPKKSKTHQILTLHITQQTSQTTIQTSRIHIPTSFHTIRSRFD